jgi:2-dehydro-3-deoxyphosphooctonate aldolase (KDO 8-P synthase)
MTKQVEIGDITVGGGLDLVLITGPCVIENQSMCMQLAEQIKKITQDLNFPFIFKASFDKANRTSLNSFRGPGIEKGLDILLTVRQKTSLPIMTDVHEPSQAAVAGKVVDCLQIPAFLCRQTDLLCACSQTGKPINIKKGQFLSPEEMKNAVDKIRTCGNEKITLTERGTFFGYHRLVNDMTAIEEMKQLGYPVIFDATHSTQQPGGLGNSSAGRREMAPILARAAIAAGANGLFIEVHTEPEKSKSNSACIMPIDWLEELLKVCKKIFNLIRG